jgi:hypothetical protein
MFRGGNALWRRLQKQSADLRKALDFTVFRE